jgi:hypothetical protein
MDDQFQRDAIDALRGKTEEYLLQISIIASLWRIRHAHAKQYQPGPAEQGDFSTLLGSELPVLPNSEFKRVQACGFSLSFSCFFFWVLTISFLSLFSFTDVFWKLFADMVS